MSWLLTKLLNLVEWYYDGPIWTCLYSEKVMARRFPFGPPVPAVRYTLRNQWGGRKTVTTPA